MACEDIQKIAARAGFALYDDVEDLDTQIVEDRPALTARERAMHRILAIGLRRILKEGPAGSTLVINGVRIAPEYEPPETAPTPKSRDMLSTAPPEVLYSIASSLDDVGFVCLRNSHPRIRSILNIDSLSMSAAHKYILRGVAGLHGIPSPLLAFCESCTVQSAHWEHYPDKKPSMAAIKHWRKHNVMVGREAILIRQDGHFCNIGHMPQKSQEHRRP